MAKRHLDFTDDNPQRRKLVKLDHAEEVNASAPQDEDKETDLLIEGEEAEAAAAREAKEKRAAQNGVPATNVEMTTNGPSTNSTSLSAPSLPTDDDIDPLDAYMAELTAEKPKPTRPVSRISLGDEREKGGKVRKDKKGGEGKEGEKQQPRVYLSDDDDPLVAENQNSNPSNILEMAKKSVKKKELPAVDHKKMNYEQFRKDFYTEPIELAQLSDEEVQRMRFDFDNIKVAGKNIPRPVQNFAQCGLGVSSLQVISTLGFETPTAIQAQAIPVIMAGRDVIGIAKTGSGKTIAFLLPMFRHIKDQRPLKPLEGPVGLIVTPTRELATQIHRECKPWLKALGLRAMCAYGGAPISEQIAELKRGAEIIVCTPGRMIDLLAANAGRVTNLKRVTYCVLDEADRMFDLGFGPQIKMILDRIRPTRQTVLFSATFPPKMDELARNVLKKPVEIIVGGRAVVGPEIKQLVEVRKNDAEKFPRLLHLLGEIHNDEDARSLVFVDRQDSAEKLMNQIMRRGYPCHAIHGGKDQFDRDSIIADFKQGVFPVLVATSVAARGLDVKQLKMVVNFDAPNHLEDYVHRAGRTGRAGNTGLAVTFVAEDQERYTPDIVKALKQSGAEVPDDIKKMSETFLERVKSGKSKAAAGGFGGKGLDDLDQRRDAAKSALRKQHKTDDDAEEEEEPAEEEGLDSLDKFKVKAKAEPEAKKEEDEEKPAPSIPTGIPSHIDLDPDKIKVEKSVREDAAPRPDKMSAAEIAKARIDARLRKAGDIRGTAPIDNKGPDAGAFHSTLEINDFPQKARWAVTNRTNVAKILEQTGTSITTKGNFYGPGKDPQPGELPKLYILVEGDTEVVVTQAMRELMRLLKDASMAAAEAEARAPTSITSRYNVV